MYTPCSYLLLLLILPISVATDCSQHPAYRKSFNPVLVSRWEFSNRSPTAEQPAYLRSYNGHLYAPYYNQKSSAYANLDLFYPLSPPDKSIRMKFQRRATIFLLVEAAPKKLPPTKAFRLKGWGSVGWVLRVHGGNTITYGVHQKLTQKMPTYAYVFKKRVKKRIVLPSTTAVRKAVGTNFYIVLIAESNGKPSPPVGQFRGRTIKPNQRCPDLLHNAWVTKDPNVADKDTLGKLFRTWHPAWDPCFWCAYDHDHGANPAAVFNYKPMYDYTAFKNNRQDESDAGFKGFIFSFGKYWVYFNLHIQAAKVRRVFVRFHTMNIVVAEKRTRKIVADLRFKADFGFVAVLTKKRILLPISKGNERVRGSQEVKNFRTINVLDPNNPNKNFLLKRDLTRGVYEEWQTIPLCSEPISPDKGVQFTLKTPGSGIFSISKSGTPVHLGRKFGGKFFRSLNLYRTVKFRRLTISDAFCPGRKNGVFYTDPSGKQVVNGPGRNSVRQYIQPGFSLFLSGKHEVTDPWQGIYTRNKKGFFRDHGFGLDPNVN